MSGVALVLAGGGARGAYEIGVLGELLPALHARGERVRIVTGASSGAINAVALAGLAHLPDDELFAVARARWRHAVLPHVLGSVALRQLPRLIARYLGSIAGLPGVRLPALFDPVPLYRHLPRWLDVPRGRRNLEAGMLDHVAVLATHAHTGRPTAFVAGGRPLGARTGTVAYHATELRVDAVLASAAIPGLFPPVELTAGPAPGWYVDGTTRLRSPLLPALRLGAEKIVVVATDAATEGAVAHAAAGPGRPGLADGLTHVLQGLVVDPLFSDVRRLARLNALLAIGDPGSLERWRAAADRPALREVPFALIAPRQPGELARLALEVLRERHGGLRALCALDARLLDRLLGGGTPLHGALLSYLLFDRHFIDGAIDLGRRDARRWLAENPDLWRLGTPATMAGTPSPSLLSIGGVADS